MYLAFEAISVVGVSHHCLFTVVGLEFSNCEAILALTPISSLDSGVRVGLDAMMRRVGVTYILDKLKNV
jgi:hypothetical protein